MRVEHKDGRQGKLVDEAGDLTQVYWGTQDGRTFLTWEPTADLTFSPEPDSDQDEQLPSHPLSTLEP